MPRTPSTPSPPPLRPTAADGTGASCGLPALRAVMARLRTAESVQELLTCAAAQQCAFTAADGAALLRVDGDEVALQALFSAVHGDITGPPAGRAPFALHRFAAEEAAVRRGRATFTGGAALGVASAGRQPWSVSEMSCVAAPIPAGRRTIGLAVGIWQAPSAAPGPAELEAVWAFADALGAIVENLWMTERLHLQLAHVRPLLMAVGAVLAEISDSAISLAPARAETLPSALPLLPAGPAASSLDDLGLSSRELEVLALMSSGATNDRVAEALTISVATVKSHVRTILRKLNASNRAEAASRYAAQRAKS